MIHSPKMYRVAPATGASPIRQGEILSNLFHAQMAVESIHDSDVVSVNTIIHPLSIVLTQDCDLEQDFKVRDQGRDSDKQIPCILFCEVSTAPELAARLGKTSKAWKSDRIPQNKNDRFHFMQRIEPAFDALHAGLEELGVDFKRYFVIPTAEVYKRVELGIAQRRTILVSPYLEHFCCRFANYLSRIGLPEDHESV